MIFSGQISRPINPADMEHYEGGTVLKMALILSGHDEDTWNKLDYRTRNKWLDRAVKSTCLLLNDTSFVDRLPMLTKNLTSRI